MHVKVFCIMILVRMFIQFWKPYIFVLVPTIVFNDICQI